MPLGGLAMPLGLPSLHGPEPLNPNTDTRARIVNRFGTRTRHRSDQRLCRIACETGAWPERGTGHTKCSPASVAGDCGEGERGRTLEVRSSWSAGGCAKDGMMTLVSFVTSFQMTPMVPLNVTGLRSRRPRHGHCFLIKSLSLSGSSSPGP